jgi:hypothetical protein
MEKSNYVDEMISRYIYQVTKELPINSRKDIDDELRTLIFDMLEEKTLGNDASPKDIDWVLTELGDPSKMADSYRDKSKYLIGPTLFPNYILVMKIALVCSLIAMSLVTMIEILMNPVDLVTSITKIITNMVSSGFSVFTWVTIIFGIIEYSGVISKESKNEWNVSSLPSLPEQGQSISIVDPIVSMLFTFLLGAIIVLKPQLFGIYFYNHTLNIVPVFDILVLKKVIPLFILVFGLSIANEILTMIIRKYTLKLGIFCIISNTLQLGILIAIFTGFSIWNQNFMSELNRIFGDLFNSPLGAAPNRFTNAFVVVLIMIYLIETGSVIYKTLKYNKSYNGAVVK